MTNNPGSDSPDERHADALAALHGMQDAPSDEAAHEEAAVPAVESTSSPSSTGLVGMLAKGQVNQSSVDLGGSKAGFPTPVPMGIPQPKVAGTKGPATKRPGKFDTIGVAKEIKMPARGQPATFSPAGGSRTPGQAGAPGRPGSRRPLKKPPDWWRAGIPIMITVASLLFFVSFWAVGAVVCMVAGMKGYPLLQPEFSMDDPDRFIGYDASSKMMAIVMLLCLPVSFSLGIFAFILNGRIKTYDRKVAAQQAAAAAAEQAAEQAADPPTSGGE